MYILLCRQTCFHWFGQIMTNILLIGNQTELFLYSPNIQKYFFRKQNNFPQTPFWQEVTFWKESLLESNKRQVEANIVMLKSILTILTMSIILFTEKLFRNCNGLMLLICIGLVIYFQTLEYNCSHKNNSELRAVIDTVPDQQDW